MILPELTIAETLFGGIIAEGIVFMVARRLKIAAFWSAMICGLLPFISYLLYSLQHRVGGDVMTIHFVVYLVTALLLMVLGSRNKSEKMHWAPRLIIGFFVFLVVIDGTLMNIASHGLPDFLSSALLPNSEHKSIHSTFPGVIPHDQNNLYEPQLEQIAQQKELGWKVKLDGLDAISINQTSLITVSIQDREGQPLSNATVMMDFWRLADSRDDQSLAFRALKPGVYQAEIVLPDEGRWFTGLRIQIGQHDFLSKQSLWVGKQ